MAMERVQCPGCLERKPIRKDGTMAKHRVYGIKLTGYRGHGMPWVVCSGSWERPGRHRKDVEVVT
jgi:hypothetical protein